MITPFSLIIDIIIYLHMDTFSKLDEISLNFDIIIEIYNDLVEAYYFTNYKLLTFAKIVTVTTTL